MSVIPSKFSIKGQVKSISLPSRSHPTTLRIEQALNAAATTAVVAPSADNICNGLFRLEEVYKCMDDLLNSSNARFLISHPQNKKWVEELIEESIKFLDVCGSIRDILAQIKDHIIGLHCVLRRRKEELSYIEKTISKYNCFRKKMRKDVKVLVGNLKQVDHMITGCDGLVAVNSDDHQLAAVMKAIIGVSEVTVSVFESLLLFFCMPVSKPNKWANVVSKLMHKGMVACEDQQGTIGNGFESVDVALQDLCKHESSGQGEKVAVAKCRLDRLENQLECMETRLECMFRRLIGTRASLLNIISM